MIILSLSVFSCNCKYRTDAVGAGCRILAGITIVGYQRELCCVGIVPDPVIPTGIPFPTI